MRCLAMSPAGVTTMPRSLGNISAAPRPCAAATRRIAPAAAAAARALHAGTVQQRRSLAARLPPLAAKKASTEEEVDLDMVALEAETDAEERMQKAVSVVADNFNTMRTGRANPAILDRITVDYYGAPTPLKSLATISVPDASTLLVSPFDRSGLKDIEKAILESDIGINPSNDGERIRLAIPAMTQERRKELSKKVSKMGEDGKIALRNVRRDVLKRLDKHEFPKDTKKALEDSIQKTTDTFVKKLDDMVKTKTEDIMKV